MEKSKEPLIYMIPENSSIELNFQSYHLNQESAVFIPSGQYIKTDPSAQTIPVHPESPNHYRYLFSRILTLGHVAADEKIKSQNTNEVLDYSDRKWRRLNPFKTTDEELEILFDANEWLDHNMDAALDIKSGLLTYHETQKLSKEKLHLTLFQWKNQKLIGHARQKLYESGGSIKETSYALGFKDSAYFCRFFRNYTSHSPGEFIKTIEEKPQEKRIVKAFKSLLKEYIQSNHSVVFYANQLNLTTKSLSRVIKSATGLTPKHHINNEIISRAKHFLAEGATVSSITFELGFEEISHFSQFFKLHTRKAPSRLQSKSTID
ncbi:helix-turn-helix domain-containing protein [Ekhidna sp. To15]|uniref:helix-turn-helix domain-containing protein n=1 Tax=Ekhidna sp. To15 TaxID=3395267 RepID=UPI003F5219D0